MSTWKNACGKQLMAVAPKDGHFYSFDLATNGLLYRVPLTQVEDVNESFSHGEDVHFCPGAVGGAEWNSPAYDPLTNLVLVGEVDWYDTATPKMSTNFGGWPSDSHGSEWRHGIRSTFSAKRPVRTDTGLDGSTPLTPTLASGSGA
jgi:hypothetical protein